MDDQEVDQITSACAETGALYFRVDIAWTDVQHEGSDSWYWDNVDRVVLSAKQKGLETIGILDYFPPWADTTTDTSFWSNFVYQAGLRYIPQGISVWELWNEPNITNFWPQPNVEEYVNQVLIPGSIAIKRAADEMNISITVLTAGLAPAATDGTNISQEDFITGIYELEASDYFDAVGHHPYCWPLDPSIPNPYNWLLKTENIYDIMVENGDGDKKIWCTELGWPTIMNSNLNVTESQQADYLAKSVKLWNEWEFTGPLLWYAYNDAGTNQNNPEDNFGLVDYDFNAKPALDAFLNLIQNCSIDTTTRVQYISKKKIIISPNPNSGRLAINGLPLNSTIRIVNAVGQVYLSVYAAQESITLDVKNISNGLFFLEIRNQENQIILLEKIIRID